MKKKTSWKTFAGLALAAGTWLKIAEDVPIHDIIAPPFKPTCRNGERLSWDSSARRWVCIPKV
jgi:hypothetical protein